MIKEMPIDKYHLAENNMSIEDIISKIKIRTDLTSVEKQKAIEKLIELKNNILAEARKNAERRGFLQVEDVETAAKSMLKLYINNLDSIEIIKSINDGRDWLLNCYKYDSSWDASVLILSLLEIGVDPKSENINEYVKWLTNKENRTEGGLWHSPWDNNANIFDTSFAVVALLKAGIRKDSDIIKNATNFIKETWEPLGGWNPIPAYKEGIDVGATSWAIIALVEAGIDPSSEIIMKSTEWLKNNQHEIGGWGRFWKNEPNSISVITRTYDVISALLKAGEDIHSPVVQKAVKWIENLQSLIREEENVQTWGWGWEGFQKENIYMSDVENTAIAVLILLIGEVEPNSPIIISGIKWLMARKMEETFWGIHTPRVVVCLNKFTNISGIHELN